MALSEAGFETGFTSLYWTYASGFPKAHNIGKTVDKRAGAKREIIGQKKLNPRDKRPYMPNKFEGMLGTDTFRSNAGMMFETAPSSPEAKRLEGSYAGFQPKPAVEVILAVMKPLGEKGYADQALHNGKGITWMDDCRIPYGDEVPNVGNRHRHDRGDGYGYKPQWQPKGGVQWSPEKEWKQDIERQAHEKGRFPANLVVSDGVLDDGRKYRSGAWNRYGKGPKVFVPPEGDRSNEWKLVRERPFGYSRFFSLDAWADLNLKDLPEVVQRNLPYLIVPKASTREKDAGLESLKPVSIKGRDEGAGQPKCSAKSQAVPTIQYSPHRKAHPAHGLPGHDGLP